MGEFEKAIDTLIQEGYSNEEISDALKKLLEQHERYTHEEVFGDTKTH